MTDQRPGPARLVTLLVLLCGLLVGGMVIQVFATMQEEPEPQTEAKVEAPTPTHTRPTRVVRTPPPSTPDGDATPQDTGTATPLRATGTVQCPVDLPDTPAVHLTQLTVQPPGAAGNAAGAIRGGQIMLQVPTGNGSGVFTVHDTQVRVAWQDVPEDGQGACTAEVIKTYTAVFGSVVGWDESWRGYATGCGGHGPIEPDGSFFATIVAEPCAMYAVLQQSGRVAHGPEVAIDARHGADTDVTLRAPTVETLRPLDDDELEMKRLVLELAEQLVANAGDPDSDAAFLDRQQADLDEALQARDEDEATFDEGEQP